MGQLGQALGEAAEGADAIDATYDEADAYRIAQEFREYERERLRTGENAYLATKGFTAGEGMEPAVKDLRAGAENLLTGARSKRARDMAKRTLDNRISAAEEVVAKHSLAEMTTARIGQSESRIGAAAEDAVEAYGTDQFAVHLGVAEMETATLGRLKGWTPEETKEAVEKQTSAVHRAVSDRLIVDDDIDEALAYLDTFKDDMRVDDEMAVRRALKPKVEFRMAEEDAALVLGVLDDDSVPAPRDESGDPVASPSLAKQLGAIESNESGGRQFDADGKPLRSHAGATGVMQVMPTTGPEAAKLAGLRWNRERLETDMNYNRALGTAYYREMLRQFDGNAELAAAAYNAGPGRVKRVLRDHGPEWEKHLPAETRDYVQKFRRKTGIAGGTVGPEMRNAGGQVDATQAYARLDEIAEREGWSPERAERARERIAVRITRDDSLRQREEAAQWVSALEQVDALGRDFTDVAKINGFADLPPDRRTELRKIAEANRKPEVEANSDVSVALQVMAIEDPEQFAATDLREYKAQITRGEFANLQLKQSKIATAPEKEISIRSGISASIGYHATEDMDLTGAKNQDRRLRVMDAMETYLRNTIPDVGAGKRAPTDDEFRKAFDFATTKIVLGKSPILGRDKTGMRFERDFYSVPREDRTRIQIAYKRTHGRLPNEQELVDAYNESLR